MIAVGAATTQFAACRACGRTDAAQRDVVRGYRIAQCPGCRLAWSHNARVDATSFYDQSYFEDADAPKGYNDYFAMASAMQRTNSKRLKYLKRFAPSSKTLLDVGCGPGFFVREATQTGLEAQGIEVSPFASDFGRRELKQSIVTGPISAATLAQTSPSPDIITMWDTIEHLSDPDEAIAILADRLAPGGLLCLTTGDVTSMAARLTGSRWHLYNLPEHLWFFSPSSLQLMLESAGLEVFGVGSEVCWYTAHYLVERLCYSAGIRTPHIPGAAALKRIPVPMTLFDILRITARKPA